MEEIKDVNPEESSTPEQVVKEEAVAQPEPQATEEQPAQTSEVGQPRDDVDERGVPWKNVAEEWRRKATEEAEKLPKVIEETIAKHLQPQQPKYSIEDYERFAETTDDPANKAWARSEIRRIEREQIRKEVREEVSTLTQEQQKAMKRQQATQYVAQNYPDCFAKDALGNVKWNEASPMVQQIKLILQDKRFGSDPEGLIAAADMAYGRLARMSMGKTTQKVQKLQRQVKVAQQAALVEGAGQKEAMPKKSVFSKHMDDLKRTGSRSAAEAATMAFLKDRGFIKGD